MGIPMAFAAVRGDLPPLAWLLMLGNLFWVLAYDTEYAMVDRDDDLKLGLKTSAITLGMWDVPVVMLFYLASISVWTLALRDYVPGVPFYIGIAVALAQVAWHVTLIRARTRDGCFKAFRLNHWLGFAVFAGIAASYAVR
jgi:4-hydroxybenzoate polyprenyltransferase